VESKKQTNKNKTPQQTDRYKLSRYREQVGCKRRAGGRGVGREMGEDR